MTLLLLVIIYIVFISLGLPDGLLGSAWPAIQQGWDLPVGLGGFIGLTVTLMTILSSLATSHLVKKMGNGWLLTISTALTAIALFGFWQAPSVLWLFLSAIPLGLGAGAIDSALNDYVAKHYHAHHMNWLHGFWGVGATIGPIVFASSLANTLDWHAGYLHLGLIQGGIVLILLLSLPLWSKVKQRKHPGEQSLEPQDASFGSLLKDTRVLYSFIAFLLYTGMEVGVGLWLASYLVAIQSVTVETAAIWSGLYFAAITVGRIGTGFISFKVASKYTIRYGAVVSLLGAALLLFNLHPALSILGILLIGVGMAPIYPGLIHITPERFGHAKSSKVMSLQMVGGYVGASIIPPVIGLASDLISLQSFAIITPTVLTLVLITNELLNRLDIRTRTR